MGKYVCLLKKKSQRSEYFLVYCLDFLKANALA